ncbi:zinc metalloprotease [Streptomyces mesophilus]|nr:hypothetical protein [Streptomyces mesophilus]
MTSVIALGVGTGAAWSAAIIDNMYPVRATDPTCRNDPEEGDGVVSCWTDNTTMTYYMDSGGDYELESEDRHAVDYSMANDFRTTDLVVTYDSNPTFSGSGETDIIYQEGNPASGSGGVTWCNDAVDGDGRRCDQQYIRIHGGGDYTRGLVCHETGHAVGLQHGNNSLPITGNTNGALGCMQTPVGSSEPLGSNNKFNINAVY